MGIVNLTEDSYYAPSRCLDTGQVAAALSRIGTLVAEGADIIDIGACSTRPGALPVGAAEEWKRMEPVLKAVAVEFPDVRISIDTYHASVIRNAYDLLLQECGPEKVKETLIINDISAGEDDPEMLPAAGELGLTYIAMHKKGDSLTMQSLCDYDNVVEEVKSYFEAFEDKAARYGIREWIIDPGFGFAKTVDQNYELLKGLSELSVCGRRILVGVSRKSMIYRKFGITPEEALPATQVLHLAALQNGAEILRVHDVAEAVRTVELYRLLR